MEDNHAQIIRILSEKHGEIIGCKSILTKLLKAAKAKVEGTYVEEKGYAVKGDTAGIAEAVHWDTGLSVLVTRDDKTKGYYINIAMKWAKEVKDKDTQSSYCKMW